MGASVASQEAGAHLQRAHEQVEGARARLHAALSASDHHALTVVTPAGMETLATNAAVSVSGPTVQNCQ